ncbi:MAG: hypothetical protein H0T66_03155 [Geodermatophilaceae bacterium]|nr:hypothetical protein [Geodermatophilaceae bacterium]
MSTKRAGLAAARVSRGLYRLPSAGAPSLAGTPSLAFALAPAPSANLSCSTAAAAAAALADPATLSAWQ